MLTKQQITLLELVKEGPRTTRGITDASWQRSGTGNFTYDQVHSSMRRLEDRELVRRSSTRPTKWELTRAGRNAIA